MRPGIDSTERLTRTMEISTIVSGIAIVVALASVYFAYTAGRMAMNAYDEVVAMKTMVKASLRLALDAEDKLEESHYGKANKGRDGDLPKAVSGQESRESRPQREINRVANSWLDSTDLSPGEEKRRPSNNGSQSSVIRAEELKGSRGLL